MRSLERFAWAALGATAVGTNWLHIGIAAAAAVAVSVVNGLREKGLL